MCLLQSAAWLPFDLRARSRRRPPSACLIVEHGEFALINRATNGHIIAASSDSCTLKLDIIPIWPEPGYGFVWAMLADDRVCCPFPLILGILDRLQPDPSLGSSVRQCSSTTIPFVHFNPESGCSGQFVVSDPANSDHNQIRA
jgi:hypothetical protein